jgi:hypothetical protein
VVSTPNFGINGFYSFSKWPPFLLVRPVSIPNHGNIGFALLQNGHHFHWLGPVSIPNPGKNRFCSFSKWPPFFTG